MRLWIATTNAGKLRDFAQAARAFPEVTIAPLAGIERITPPEETADTFFGNARIKAVAYSRLAPGQLVVADDSGLSVRGLDGAPGVRSARYAEDEGFAGEAGQTVDERNNACLLERAARMRYKDIAYVCSLAVVRDGALIASAAGELQGRLMDAPRGTLGFGYDPLFEVLELGLTMAEVDEETRIKMSHRGRALVRLIKILTATDERATIRDIDLNRL